MSWRWTSRKVQKPLTSSAGSFSASCSLPRRQRSIARSFTAYRQDERLRALRRLRYLEWYIVHRPLAVAGRDADESRLLPAEPAAKAQLQLLPMGV